MASALGVDAEYEVADTAGRLFWQLATLVAVGIIVSILLGGDALGPTLFILFVLVLALAGTGMVWLMSRLTARGLTLYSATPFLLVALMVTATISLAAYSPLLATLYGVGFALLGLARPVLILHAAHRESRPERRG